MSRLLTVDGTSWPYPHGGGGADIRITVAGRWLRVGASFGEAAGSRMAGKHAAAWLTKVEDLRGVNVRFGRWPGECLTIWAHTRPSQSSTDPR